MEKLQAKFLGLQEMPGNKYAPQVNIRTGSIVHTNTYNPKKHDLNADEMQKISDMMRKYGISAKQIIIDEN